jgi:DNA-binding transcriptional ArsR family regulator
VRCRDFAAPLTGATTTYILYHVERYSESRLDRVFSALSDPTRRKILARLEKESALSLSDLAEPFEMTLPAVMKHVRILADTGLVRRFKTGRTVWVEIEAGSMKGLMEWLDSHRLFWSKSLDRLAAYAERKERQLGSKGR